MLNFMFSYTNLKSVLWYYVQLQLFTEHPNVLFTSLFTDCLRRKPLIRSPGSSYGALWWTKLQANRQTGRPNSSKATYFTLSSQLSFHKCSKFTHVLSRAYIYIYTSATRKCRIYIEIPYQNQKQWSWKKATNIQIKWTKTSLFSISIAVE